MILLLIHIIHPALLKILTQKGLPSKFVLLVYLLPDQLLPVFLLSHFLLLINFILYIYIFHALLGVSSRLSLFVRVFLICFEYFKMAEIPLFIIFMLVFITINFVIWNRVAKVTVLVGFVEIDAFEPSSEDFVECIGC